MPRTTISAGSLALASVGNDFAQLTYDQPRNGLINGSFEIWQRGTTGLAGATSAANGFQADRWQAFRTGFAAGMTGSQTTGTAQTRYALRMTRTAGNTSLATLNLLQNIETANAEVFAGQQVTFSAWIRRGADYAGTFNMRILSGTGTDQNVIGVGGFTGQVTVVSQSRTVTTGWARYSVTGTIGSTASELAAQFQYTPTTATAGANDWFEITGAQLEIGAAPSTFQMHGGSVQAELVAAQRYFRRYGFGTSSNIIVMGGGSGTTSTNFFAPLYPPMRIAPSSVAYNNIQMKDATGATTTVTGLSLINGSPTATCIVATHAANDVAHRLYCLDTSATTGYIDLNAEV
jgi:hypothetical protein